MTLSPSRDVSLAIIVALMWCRPAFAQNPARDSLLQDLRRTMAALATARAAGEGNVWSRYVTDEFVVIHPDGRIHNRTEEIAELNASKPTAVLVREAERFHWYAETTVIYVSDFISIRGQSVRAIEVWIRQGLAWKIAAAQVTRLAE
jgi:Domain of unknown function (DUF4440)